MTDETVEVSAAETEAAFAQGFEQDTDGQEAVAVEQKPGEAAAEKPAAGQQTTEPAETPPDAAAQAPAKDEWEGVHPKVRQLLEGITGTVGTLTNTVKRTEGRVGALQSAMDAAKNVEKAGGAAPTPKEIAEAAKSSENWERAKVDYPDWVEAMEDRLAAERAKTAPAKPVDVSALRSELNEVIKSSINEAREMMNLDRIHPGWQQTVGTPEFKTYALEGGPSIKQYDHYKLFDYLSESEQGLDGRFQTNEARDRYAQRAKEMVAGFAREFPQWWGERGASLFDGTSTGARRTLDSYAARQKQDNPPDTKGKRTERLAAAVAPKGVPQAGQTSESIEAAFAAGFSGN